LQALENDKTAMVDTQVIHKGKLLERRVEAGDDGRAPGNTRREVIDQSSGDRVGRGSRIPSGR
jgi:hypothetical protein